VDFVWSRGVRAIGIEVKAATTWRAEYGHALKSLLDQSVLKGARGISLERLPRSEHVGYGRDPLPLYLPSGVAVALGLERRSVRARPREASVGKSSQRQRDGVSIRVTDRLDEPKRRSRRVP
jgi:hypothetical protein